ncbi:MAG: phospholipid carrier-dependent glycosyltransferase [Patescibacteria group bacterium]
MKDKFYGFIPSILLVIIVLGSGLLMFDVSRQESATMDELAHIPAGYSYVKYLDYRLNPEHPPLLKVLAALPLLGMDLKFPTDSPKWEKEVNYQWDIGSLFLFNSGNNPDDIVKNARIFPIIITLLTVILIYLWSRELLGKWWALLPAFLFAVSPSVLAHGHYVTTDIAAAFGFLLAAYLFVKFLNRRSGLNIILAGIGLGIALLLKFSTVLLIPLFIALAFFYWFGEKIRGFETSFWRHAKNLILIFIVALAAVYAAYFVFTLNYPIEKQVSDTKSILENFQPQALAQFNVKLSESRLMRPLGEYFLGVMMVLQRSAGGNTSYFLGEVSKIGWHYYFPVVFLLKESVPTLILLFLSMFFGLKNTIVKSKGGKIFQKFAEYLGTNFAEFSLLLLVLLYWAYSINSTLNIGFRHLLPLIAPMYILAASGLKNWLNAGSKNSAKRAILAIVLIWCAAETFAAYPYFLSYFNEIGGGTMNGYKYVADSNYDWGQDLKRLAKFVKNPPGGGSIEKIAVDYFGAGDPAYYLGKDTVEGWYSSKGDPREENIEWLAVSAEFLQNSVQPTDSTITRKPGEDYGWLKELRPAPAGLGNTPQPDYRVGTSIFIYHL